MIRWSDRFQRQEVKLPNWMADREFTPPRAEDGNSPPSHGKNLMAGGSQIPKPFVAAAKDSGAGPSVFGSLYHYFPCALLPPTDPRASLNHDRNLQQISTLWRPPELH